MESESYIKYSLWGGRFDMGCDELMKKFNESFSLDKRLWKQDITVYTLSLYQNPVYSV